MAATRQDISEWFDRGLAGGWGLNENSVTHMIVMVDDFDYEDYPVYVHADEDVREVMAEKDASPMQRVMEVYNLSMDKDQQLNEERAFNF